MVRVARFDRSLASLMRWLRRRKCVADWASWITEADIERVWLRLSADVFQERSALRRRSKLAMDLPLYVTRALRGCSARRDRTQENKIRRNSLVRLHPSPSHFAATTFGVEGERPGLSASRDSGRIA